MTQKIGIYVDTSFWMKDIHKSTQKNSDILTPTEVLVNRKRVKIHEQTVQSATWQFQVRAITVGGVKEKRKGIVLNSLLVPFPGDSYSKLSHGTLYCVFANIHLLLTEKHLETSELIFHGLLYMCLLYVDLHIFFIRAIHFYSYFCAIFPLMRYCHILQYFFTLLKICF